MWYFLMDNCEWILQENIVSLWHTVQSRIRLIAAEHLWNTTRGTWLGLCVDLYISADQASAASVSCDFFLPALSSISG